MINRWGKLVMWNGRFASRTILTVWFLFISVVLLHTATANGFQMVTSGAQSKAISDWAITSLEVRDLIII